MEFIQYARLALFTLLALAFGYWTWRRGSLTAGGAAAAVALGCLVTLRAGASWLLPLFTFFLSSSLLERLLPTRQLAGDAKEGRARDLVQVICNGGVYGTIAWLGLDPLLLLIAAGVATADTWASGIGKYLRQPTYDILRMRRVPPGLSGGVSIGGNAGGVAGAILIGSLGFLLLPDYSVGDLLTVAVVGFAGMLIDSILGAGLQARYRHASSGLLSDARLAGSHLVSGLRWMTNDLVNLLAIAVTVYLSYLLL